MLIGDWLFFWLRPYLDLSIFPTAVPSSFSWYEFWRARSSSSSSLNNHRPVCQQVFEFILVWSWWVELVLAHQWHELIDASTGGVSLMCSVEGGHDGDFNWWPLHVWCEGDITNCFFAHFRRNFGKSLMFTDGACSSVMCLILWVILSL